MEKKNYAARAAIYAMGLVILAAGITMNIKTGLGVSTIISVPFAISSIWDVNFSLVTFATYALFVVIEMIIKGSDRTVIDWLQIPFSIVFSLLLNMFSKLLDFQFRTFVGKHAVSGSSDNLHGCGNVNDDSHEVRAEPSRRSCSGYRKSLWKEHGLWQEYT